MIYVTTAWSKVYAFDAKTGKELWKYDPKVPGEWAVNACCDVVNRGVAAWNGKVYLATIDARLIALDAATGKPVWDVYTIEPGQPYAITGAPRVAKGKVLIGQGGSEFSQRGYVSAYDAETGKLDWRWYVVPGDPAKGFENPQMEAAAKTWNGEWWKTGGGGAPWDRIVYDPTTDLRLRRHRQRRAVAGGDPLARRRRPPVPLVDRRAGSGHRQVRLALPDHAERKLGLRQHLAADHGRPHDRRREAPRGDAGAEERLLLRARCEDRQAAVGRCPMCRA